MIEGDHLMSQIVKENQRTLQRLHFHSVFNIHLSLEPIHEAIHIDVYHSFQLLYVNQIKDR